MSDPHSDHHRALERVYLRAPVNRAYAPTIQVESGEATIEMATGEEHHHGGGATHGAVLFKLLDDAAFFAVNSRVRDQMVVTASFHVHFVRPVTAGRLRAEGRLISRTRRLSVADAVVLDERGRELARGSGTFLPSGLRVETLPGYLAPGA